MISVNDFKNGLTIQVDGELWRVVEFQHVKPGKGSAFVRSKLKNLRNGGVQEKTFRAGEKVEQAPIETSKMIFSYDDGNNFVFMNNETFEQIEIPKTKLEWEKNFITDGTEVTIIRYENELLGASLPDQVAIPIAEAEEAVQGNTVQNVTKKAWLVTGWEILVPQFIKSGEVVLIRTSDGQYVGRAK